jgi:hypothetical protein
MTAKRASRLSTIRVRGMVPKVVSSVLAKIAANIRHDFLPTLGPSIHRSIILTDSVIDSMH